MKRLMLPLCLAFTTAHAGHEVDREFEIAEALIRHQVSTHTLTSDSRVCIYVAGKDIPPDFVKRLKDTNLKIVSAGPSCEACMPIGKPELNAEGETQMSYGYFTNRGDGCSQGQLMFAFMRQDKDGWHVVRVQGSVYF